KRDSRDRDRDAALGPLTQLAVGGEGGDYEPDQRDDETQAGDQNQYRCRVVGEVDKTAVDVRRQPSEVRRYRDIVEDPRQLLVSFAGNAAVHGWTGADELAPGRNLVPAAELELSRRRIGVEEDSFGLAAELVDGC